jgi:hypothetical protein
VNYLQEWGSSCVDDQLTRLNVTPLEGQGPYEYLLYSDAIPRRNDGRVRDHIFKRYQHLEEGGWWCSGIDVLTGSDDIWGCFKPSQPLHSSNDRKLIKYEHPPLAPSSLFALRLPQLIWQRIAARYQLEVFPSDIDPDQSDLGFWQWLVNHPSIPLCITEGAKKAGALLTAGYAAIALPGVNGGCRVQRDELGNRIGKSRLIPQLLKLATQRPIYLAFDQDSQPTTIKRVSAAIRQLGHLLKQQGCPVKVITWNTELGKGVDDLIAAHGQGVFEQAYQTAATLDTWKAKSLTRLTHPPDLRVHCRYLPELPIPAKAKLIGIKSPKGTGKTQLLEGIVSQALAREQWVLVIGHRVRLVEALCQRFGLNYVTEVRDCDNGNALGYGLCLDSLHPASQARFNAVNWLDGVVIIDEVEQVLWHGLDSSTCSTNRVAILKSLKTLMQNVLGGEGQVFIADADLSDISIDYLVSLAGIHPQLFIIENDWKPGLDESWLVHSYPDSTPASLVRDLERHIREGGKPFVCLSAQKLKSQWGTCSLEAYLQRQFPQLRILRIDSESLAEPTHPAYGCMTSLNQVLGNYDVVLASPVIETGVSIDIRGHFTSVWGIAQGLQSENSVRQALGRIRENLPRFIWVAAYGFNQVGNGSTSIPSLLTSGQSLSQLNIRLLQQSDFDALDDLEMGFQAESLLCWAKMAVRLNASMVQYRESVLTALRGEGHQVIEAPSRDFGLGNAGQDLENAVTDHSANNQKSKIKNLKSKWEDTQAETNSLTAAITVVKNQNYQAECEAIAKSEDLSDSQYQVLKKRLVKTTAQRRSLRKHDLKLRYGIPVTAELVAKDDDGWYPKLRLHYFLSCGREHLAERDAAWARSLIELGQGSIFLPDFNRSQFGAVVSIMEILGIPVLIQDHGRELKNTDEDLRAMAAIALSNRSWIKTTLGIGLAPNATPITIIRCFLDKIGYKLKFIRRVRVSEAFPNKIASRAEGTNQNRVRIYQVVNPNDGRVEVFKQWLAFDRKPPSPSESWRDSRSSYVNSTAQSTGSDEVECVQLCLSF